MFSKIDWSANRSKNYAELKLSESPKLIIHSLQKELNTHFNKAVFSFSKNLFAEFKNGKLKIHTDEALSNSTSLQELQNLVAIHLEPIRIEKLLTELQRKTNYLKAFKPIEGFNPQTPLQLPILNATLTAHATNLGLYGISKSTNEISIDKLRHVSNWYITTENLKEASQILIDAQQKYWLTSIFGKGARSASDAQRFVINKKSVIGSIYPRDFGALVKGIGLYPYVGSIYCIQHSSNFLFCTRSTVCS